MSEDSCLLASFVKAFGSRSSWALPCPLLCSLLLLKLGCRVRLRCSGAVISSKHQSQHYWLVVEVALIQSGGQSAQVISLPQRRLILSIPRFPWRRSPRQGIKNNDATPLPIQGSGFLLFDQKRKVIFASTPSWLKVSPEGVRIPKGRLM